MKLLVAILAFFNGGYMLLDGIYVLLKGKYIGPPRPGPWAILFEKAGINVFRLGPVFIIFGLLWLTWIYALYTHQTWAYLAGLVLSIFTLWYLPVGTFISVVILVLLLTSKAKLGL